MKQKNFLKIVFFLLFVLIGFSSFSQSVVINEIVTDPQQDWSTNGFNGVAGSSSITQGTDEWIELYIKTDGLDLTGWTIELNDSSPVTGDLTNTGAFDVSNYISSNGGTFTSTKNGDFLVLGNVNSTGAINNTSLTINLKNSVGTIIDTVNIGGATGEAPSGNAGNIGDESLFRIPNGADTDTDDVDFSKGVVSLGSLNPTQVSWDGSSSNDWSNAVNWAHGSVPTGTDNVYISSGLSNYPTTTAAVTVNSVIISSGATLKAEDSFIGDVTYKRSLSYDADNTKAWYLVSSPVSGEIMTDMRANNSFVTNGSSEISFAPYDNSQAVLADRWSYFSNTATTPLVNGKGYSTKLSALGDISFTGTINTSNSGVTIPLTQGSGSGGNNFNAIGNPYTTYINSGTFLTEEGITTTDITSATLWLWNQSTETYQTKVAGDSFKIAPGQAFFVEANSTNNVTFTEAMQSHETTDTFQKSESRPEIHLFMKDGDDSRFLKVHYINGKTKGFDNGYDGELFGGVSHPFAIYSHLLEDNQGKNFQIQSLPNSNLESMIIPIGVNTLAGKEVTFSAEALNLPTELKVFLEDRLTNTFTRLDEANSEYKIILTEALNGVGRFYLHTVQSVLATDDVILNSVSIYKTNAATLKIAGLPQGKASISLYNILGKEMMSSSFTSNGNKEISLSKLSSGVYVAKVETEKGVISKKIILE